MQTFYSDQHYLQSPAAELAGGKLVPSFENPQRAEHILARIQQVGLGDISAPADFGLAALHAVHDADYLDFLQTAWAEWTAAGKQGEIIPLCWPAHAHASLASPHINAKVGRYALGTDTNITAGSWQAAYAGAQSALNAAAHLQANNSTNHANSAFALCRPPGHHAARNVYGGYCFLNNAAIAAQYLRDQGKHTVAILDVDFHHGNGTQDIFYQRADVLFVSIHGEPEDSFPYFWGYAHERGADAGCGFNLNLPLAAGTRFSQWRAALQTGLQAVSDFGAEALIVSLGVDTFEQDPISSFKLKTANYLTIGADIATLKLPTAFVLEGGYNVAELGVNVVNVLQGFEGQA